MIDMLIKKSRLPKLAALTRTVDRCASELLPTGITYPYPGRCCHRYSPSIELWSDSNLLCSLFFEECDAKVDCQL